MFFTVIWIWSMTGFMCLSLAILAFTPGPWRDQRVNSPVRRASRAPHQDASRGFLPGHFLHGWTAQALAPQDTEVEIEAHKRIVCSFELGIASHYRRGIDTS